MKFANAGRGLHAVASSEGNVLHVLILAETCCICMALKSLCTAPDGQQAACAASNEELRMLAGASMQLPALEAWCCTC